MKELDTGGPSGSSIDTRTGVFPPPSIVAESSEWIVVDKPPHQLVHPSKPSHRRTLWDQLRDLLAFELACGGQISIINRLDRETSGLTLVAKTGKAAREFGKLMEQRLIHKDYLAIVQGWPCENEWVVDAPILRQGEKLPSLIYLKQAVHPDGSSCRTRFQVVERLGNDTKQETRFSLVRAWPETGRLHQIRVHLSHSGYPIVGDKLYGPDEGCYLEYIKTDWTPSLAKRLLLPRHALHSTGMAVPSLGLSWTSPIAKDLATFLELHGES